MAISENEDKYQGGGLIDFTRPTRFRAALNILDRVEFNPAVPGDNSQHFFEMAGTLPSSPNAGLVEGATITVTSAGAAPTYQGAVGIYLDQGYSGAGNSQGLYVQNLASGTGGSLIGNLGNFAITTFSGGVTSGANVGVYGWAQNGDKNAGIVGHSIEPKNGATNIGGAFFGRNDGTTPIQIGVYAGMNPNVDPTFESGAIVADNSNIAVPVIVARDNGTAVWSVQDGGSIQSKMGAKTLTESADTAFVRISVPQGTAVAGFVKYAIEANDGTDFQVRTGLLPFGAVNKAGTETPAVATVSAATETVAVSAGTLTNTFTSVSNAADTVDIRANAVSSLTQTTLRINYSVELYGNAVVTVTPL